MTADRRAGSRDFAALLRQRRRAAALTQAELARLAGLAVRTVREAERGRTTRPQRTTAVLLADALELTGPERAGFLGAARGEGAVPPVSLPRTANDHGPVRLPPAPPLLGREPELAALAELLTQGPVGPVTLVGVGGVGKSVLALALAHRVADRFPGGVVSVSIDHEQLDAIDLLDAIGAGLGWSTDERGQPVEAGAPALLVIDGVDRAASGVFRKLLPELPATLRVLTTGRVPLGVPGERVWPVTPLSLPPARPDPGGLAALRQVPAVALFLARLARVRVDELAADEIPALVSLVRQLGGLPLALELAAAQGRLLRLPQILQRFGDRVLDLGEEEGEEQTLRAAVAGTYRLLSPAEQAAVRRLAVVRDRWSVELAEHLLAVDRPGRDPVPLLDRLVSLGLVEVRGVGEYRFRMLRVVRAFALEQAARHRELTEARRRHARAITDLAARLTPRLVGRGSAQAMANLDEVASEVWVALSHAANDDPVTALRLAAELRRWWRMRGLAGAGRRWLRRLLDDPRTAAAPPAVRAWARVGLARLAYEQGEGEMELPAARAALEEFRRLGDAAGELTAVRLLEVVCRADGRYGEARGHCEAALLLATRHQRDRDAALAQLSLAWHEVRRGDETAARRRLAAADRLAAQSGDRRLRLLAAIGLAELARLNGRYEQAVATAGRALPGLADMGEPRARQRLLGTLGQALATLGRCQEAEAVLAELRGDGAAESVVATAPPSAGSVSLATGMAAAIEARLALARRDRVVATEWFAAAAAALSGGAERRDRIEATVELAACLTGRQRQRVLQELGELCRSGGFVLLQREQRLLGDCWR